MPVSRLQPAQREFQQRLLVQLRSRYPSWEFDPAEDGLQVSARRERFRMALSLETLFAEVEADRRSVPERISRFVAAAGPRLSAAEEDPGRAGLAPDPETLVWCVRAERGLRAHTRFPELVTRALPGGLMGFVAEALPGDAMRGVSLKDAEAAGLGAEQLAADADRNTRLRLTRWRGTLEHSEGSSWLFSDDILFSSSLLVVPEFLQELATRGRGEAAVAVPDRAQVVAAVADAAQPARLLPAVRRLYRLAQNPLSPVLLRTDGEGLALHPAERPLPDRSGWRRFFGSWPE